MCVKVALSGPEGASSPKQEAPALPRLEQRVCHSVLKNGSR